MVEWEDSARPIPTWEWIDDYEVPETVRCVSVGFLIADRKKAIALAPNLGNLTYEVATASGIIRIPRHAIQRMTRLRSIIQI